MSGAPPHANLYREKLDRKLPLKATRWQLEWLPDVRSFNCFFLSADPSPCCSVAHLISLYCILHVNKREKHMWIFINHVSISKDWHRNSFHFDFIRSNIFLQVIEKWKLKEQLYLLPKEQGDVRATFMNLENVAQEIHKG